MDQLSYALLGCIGGMPIASLATFFVFRHYAHKTQRLSVELEKAKTLNDVYENEPKNFRIDIVYHVRTGGFLMKKRTLVIEERIHWKGLPLGKPSVTEHELSSEFDQQAADYLESKVKQLSSLAIAAFTGGLPAAVNLIAATNGQAITRKKNRARAA